MIEMVGIYKLTESYSIANTGWKNNYAVEEEKHYEELRTALYLQEWSNYNSCDILFVIIMSETRYQGIIALAKYMNLAFDKRKDI